jgi:hypothetical protein
VDEAFMHKQQINCVCIHGKTGKPKLGHLNFTQLEELLNKSTKPKEKVKIQNHITRKTKKQHVEAKL